MYEYIILVTAVVGIGINVLAFVLMARKTRRSMFHNLLKILMVYDMFVVICCMLQFALPFIWKAWYQDVRSYILPWLLPGMHIAVMSSVYFTVLMSFERFIRICYYCQLQFTSILTDENVKYYKLFVILFPVIFYIPKFFEIRTHPQVIPAQTIDCGQYMMLAGQVQSPNMKEYMESNFDADHISKIEELAHDCALLNYGPKEEKEEPTRLLRWGVLDDFVQSGHGIEYFINRGWRHRKRRRRALGRVPWDCSGRGIKCRHFMRKSLASRVSRRPTRQAQIPLTDFRSKLDSEDQTESSPTDSEETNSTSLTSLEREAVVRYLMLQRKSMKPIQNLTIEERTEYTIEPTTLRMNTYYYRIYYVFLNTLFASLLPFVLMLYLNIRTAQALFKMGIESSPVIGQNLFHVRKDDQDQLGQTTCTEVFQNDATHHSIDSVGPSNGRQMSVNTFRPSVLLGETSCTSPTSSLKRKNRQISVTIEDSRSDHPCVREGRQPEEAQTLLTPRGSHSPAEERVLSPVDSIVSCQDIGEPPRMRAKAMSFTGKRFRNSFSEALSRHGSVLRRKSTTHSLGDTINNSREKRMGLVSLWIVWLFLFCHVWKLIPTAYEVIMSQDEVGLEIADWPHWVVVVEKLSHTLITLNSSVNFLIYLAV
eukprot:maker-scaffold90_size386344-snap-gene-2.26 protein:Tk12051 transcript:maker-scaffold90_size386344-snap-gene-2.26-mRNA-1 annotation:"GJ13605"